MEKKKVSLVALRKGTPVVIGESLIEYDPKNPETAVVLDTTFYSNAVVREINKGVRIYNEGIF